MRVVYTGTMTGHHVIGRTGVTLRPGVNEVPDDVGERLVEEELALRYEDTHLAKAEARAAAGDELAEGDELSDDEYTTGGQGDS